MQWILSATANDWPTAEELKPFLGTRWAVCRNTPRNAERYGRCVTRTEYKRAQTLALAARHNGDRTMILHRMRRGGRVMPRHDPEQGLPLGDLAALLDLDWDDHTDDLHWLQHHYAAGQDDRKLTQ